MTKLTTHVLDVYSGKPGKGSARSYVRTSSRSIHLSTKAPCVRTNFRIFQLSQKQIFLRQNAYGALPSQRLG